MLKVGEVVGYREVLGRLDFLGDVSRTWFSELVEALRREWKPAMPWEEIIALRDRLDSIGSTRLTTGLQAIRLSRGTRPPTMWCPVCNQRTQQAPPSVSIRALILALGRFGIAPQTQVKSLEKRWAKHRKQNGLDRNGKPSEGTTKPHSLAVSPRPHRRACCRRPLVTSAGAHDGQEDKAVGGDFAHDAPRRRPR